MKLPIYLDYSATCPVDPRVAEKMVQYMTMDGTFGNPASRSHRYGWQAEEAVDTAREQIAALLNADPRELCSLRVLLNLTTSRSKVLLTSITSKASTSSPAKPNTKRYWIPCANWSVKALK